MCWVCSLLDFMFDNLDGVSPEEARRRQAAYRARLHHNHVESKSQSKSTTSKHVNNDMRIIQENIVRSGQHNTGSFREGIVEHKSHRNRAEEERGIILHTGNTSRPAIGHS